MMISAPPTRTGKVGAVPKVTYLMTCQITNRVAT